MNKKLAELNMGQERIIKGFVTEPISYSYYEIQIVKVINPIRNDWKTNDIVKISKGLVEKFEFKS